jgi:hypothetical protein
MNQEDINTMLAEILEKFIIYMYDKSTNEDFNYEFIIANFIDCEEDDTTKLFIFNLFQKNIYYNQIQKHIRYIYFTYDDDNDNDIEFGFNEQDLNDYKYITTFITHYYATELKQPLMIDFINSIIQLLQPQLK